MQKKILKFIYFRKKKDHSFDIFDKNCILTVYELHIYELLKFVLRSIKGLHTEDTLNNMFEFETSHIHTRSSKLRLLKVKLCRTKMERNSIYYRSAKLFNSLQSMQLLPDNITNLTPNQLTSFVHSFRMNFLIGNETIIKVIFPIRIT